MKAISINQQVNKWIGTEGLGILKFDGNQWTTYNTTNGLINNYVNTIANDKKGNIWIGTFDGVSEFKN